MKTGDRSRQLALLLEYGAEIVESFDVNRIQGDRLLKTRYSIGYIASILQQNTQVIVRLSAVRIDFARALIIGGSFCHIACLVQRHCQISGGLYRIWLQN